MPLIPSPITTRRLVLAPISRELAQSVASGDVTAVTAGEGWPHEDTVDGLRMALEHGHAPGWLVTLDGVVIGDCGVHGEPDEAGTVEIGFGLAAPYRGRGYGTELAEALSRCLLGEDGITRVVGRTTLDNEPSRRVLERAGFVLQATDERYAMYSLDLAVGE